MGTLPTVSGIVLVNVSAGSAGNGLDEIRRRFAGHRLLECGPGELEAAVDEACADPGISFVGMAGGDGSMRTLAHRLHDTDIALLVIPAGTRNHLAKDLGIDDVETAGRAADGTVRHIDLGRVNDEVFVNNLSVGLYPRMVRRREQHQERFPKPVANLIAAFDQMLRGRRTRISVDGVTHLAWAVFIGNGRYGTDLGDLVSRDTLDDGLLDVRVIRADRRLGRLRVTLAVLLGRLDRSPLVSRFHAETITLEPKHPVVEVALDGEVVTLGSPLEVSCLARGLAVLVPDGGQTGVC